MKTATILFRILKIRSPYGHYKFSVKAEGALGHEIDFNPKDFDNDHTKTVLGLKVENVFKEILTVLKPRFEEGEFGRVDCIDWKCVFSDKCIANGSTALAPYKAEIVREFVVSMSEDECFFFMCCIPTRC